jgi:hypothetical protein
MGGILNLGVGLIPLREGIHNPWVSALRPTFDYLRQFWFFNVYVFLHRVSGALTAPHGGSP